MIFDLDFLFSILRIATPLMFAALGVLIAERSGVFFLGVEGAMLLGAFFGFYGASALGSPWLGVVLGTFAGLAGGSVLALLTVLLPTNQVVVGLAFNIVCVGITSFAFRLVSDAIPSMTLPLQFHVPEWLATAPGMNLFLAVPSLTWLAIALMLAVSYFLYRTPAGLMLRSAGNNRHAALSAGINIRFTRGIALVVAGGMAGLGGTALTVGWIRSFSDEVTLGRGFIALAAVYFGRWYPRSTIVACVVFGLGDAMGFRAQMLGGNPHFYLMAPYVLTVIGVAIAGRAVGPREVGRAED